MAALEGFGPRAPLIPVLDPDDAISFHNSGPQGLSSAIVTRNLSLAIKACKELKSGRTNVNEVPGYRLELTPSGGTRDSGPGVKEGVIGATRFCTCETSWSLSW